MASAADRIAALRAKVVSEREKARETSQTASSSARSSTEAETVADASIDFERKLAEFRADADAKLREAVARAVEKEQAKTAAIVEAMNEGSGATEGADGDDARALRQRVAALTERASEAERMRGMDLARNASREDEHKKEIATLRSERDKLEDEEDEVAEEQEREIDEAREEERREYERRLSDLKKNMSGNDAEVTRLREVIKARDEEVENLQKALGAYYAEIESADAQRIESANLRQKLAALTSQATADRAACMEAKEKAKEAEERLTKFEAHLKIAKEECIKATSDASKLRKALHHALQKSSDMMVESEKLLDKRIVSDLFIAYLERERAEDVLDLLAKMLGFTDKQKARMEALKRRQKKRGVLGTIARAPVSIAAGAIGVALEVTGATGENKPVPVADLWISFLEQNAANDEEVENKIPSSSELISAAREL
jgi:hypothetical protein